MPVATEGDPIQQSCRALEVGRLVYAHLMRQAGVKPVWERKLIRTTGSKHNLPIAANTLNRQFNIAIR